MQFSDPSHLSKVQIRKGESQWPLQVLSYTSDLGFCSPVERVTQISSSQSVFSLGPRSKSFIQ